MDTQLGGGFKHCVKKEPSSGNDPIWRAYFSIGWKVPPTFSHPGNHQISADQLPWFDPTDVARMWGTQLRPVMSIQCRHPPYQWDGGAWVRFCGGLWLDSCMLNIYIYHLIHIYIYIHIRIWLWCHRIRCYDIISLVYCICYMMQCFAWWHSWCFASVSISLKMWKLRVCFYSLLYIAFPQTFSDSQKG